MRILAGISFLFIISTSALAQTDSTMLSGRFFKMMLYGSNRFALQATSTTKGVTFFNTENHGISAELGYGSFYKGNKSFQAGIGASLSQSYSRTRTDWNNAFSAYAERSVYKNIYRNKVLFSLSTMLMYTYAYNRLYASAGYTQPPTPASESSMFNFSIKPGVVYSFNRSVLLHLNISMISLGLNHIRYYSSDSRSTSNTTYSYNLFSESGITSVQLGLMWRPAFINKNTIIPGL